MEGPQWTGPDRPDRPAVARPAVARPTRTGPDYPCHTSILSYLPCWMTHFRTNETARSPPKPGAWVEGRRPADHRDRPAGHDRPLWKEHRPKPWPKPSGESLPPSWKLVKADDRLWSHDKSQGLLLIHRLHQLFQQGLSWNKLTWPHSIYKHDLSLFFPRVAESLSKLETSHTYRNLSGPRLSVPSPNRQELRAPLYLLGPHQPNPMPPRLRYFQRGKPTPDSLQSLTGGFVDFSTPRNSLARLKNRKSETFRLAFPGSPWLHYAEGERVAERWELRAQCYVESNTDSCLVMGPLNQTRPQLVFSTRCRKFV